MLVNISKRTEVRLREIAIGRGQDAADFAGSILEKEVEEIEPRPCGRKTLSDMKGMFSGGDGNTAENASEILRAGIKSEWGFGG